MPLLPPPTNPPAHAGKMQKGRLVAGPSIEYLGLWFDIRERTFPRMPNPLPGCRAKEGGKYYLSKDVAASVRQLMERIKVTHTTCAHARTRIRTRTIKSTHTHEHTHTHTHTHTRTHSTG